MKKNRKQGGPNLPQHSCSCILFSNKFDSEFINVVISCVSHWEHRPKPPCLQAQPKRYKACRHQLKSFPQISINLQLQLYAWVLLIGKSHTLKSRWWGYIEDYWKLIYRQLGPWINWQSCSLLHSWFKPCLAINPYFLYQLIAEIHFQGKMVASPVYVTEKSIHPWYSIFNSYFIPMYFKLHTGATSKSLGLKPWSKSLFKSCWNTTGCEAEHSLTTSLTQILKLFLGI